MSGIRAGCVFTSESVSEGHPDKVCDQISDAILDACLAKDPKSRVACETLATTNLVVNVGEIACEGWNEIDTEFVAREVVHDIGYDRKDLEFSSKTFEYINRLHGQSPDISQGVTEGEGLFSGQGAGDQGMMFGYADNTTDELMPTPISCSRRLLDELQRMRKSGSIDYLRPDSKSQVSIKYVEDKPVSIETVVVSHQTDDVPLKKIREDLIRVCQAVLEPTGLLKADTEYFINPTGKFVIGGPHGDAGITGRKIIADTYGGIGSHGGGAFSGKDPSKVDRSAAYYSRYAAKNIVAAGLAEKCEIRVAYAIGVTHPLNISVNTYGKGKVSDRKIEEVLQSGEVFDFRPAALIADLGLLHPRDWSYREAAAYGHFGRAQFPWERTDKTNTLQRLLFT